MIRDWDQLLDGSGVAGTIKQVWETVLVSTDKDFTLAMEDLSESIIVPGSLCSAEPAIILELLELAPRFNSRQLEWVFGIVRMICNIAVAADRELLIRSSAITPYRDFEALEKALFEAVGAGEPIFWKRFGAGRGWPASRMLAGILLTHCGSTRVDDRQHFITVLEEALSSPAVDEFWRIELFHAACRMLEPSGVLEEFLDRHIGSPTLSIRVLVRIQRPEKLSDLLLEEAVKELVSVRGLTLQSLLSGLPIDQVVRVYRVVLRRNPFPASLLTFCGDLLRCVFDERLRIVGQSGRSEEVRAQYGLRYHKEFDFRGGPLAPVGDLTRSQRGALEAIANCDPAWEQRTNLWEHFGLPDTQAGMKRLLEQSCVTNE